MATLTNRIERLESAREAGKSSLVAKAQARVSQAMVQRMRGEIDDTELARVEAEMPARMRAAYRAWEKEQKKRPVEAPSAAELLQIVHDRQARIERANAEWEVKRREQYEPEPEPLPGPTHAQTVMTFTNGRTSTATVSTADRLAGIRNQHLTEDQLAHLLNGMLERQEIGW